MCQATCVNQLTLSGLANDLFEIQSMAGSRADQAQANSQSPVRVVEQEQEAERMPSTALAVKAAAKDDKKQSGLAFFLSTWSLEQFDRKRY